MAFTIAPSVEAVFVQTDFNDQSAGVLRFQTVGGTGLTGDWGSNSGVPDIVADNLTAPASTHFNLTQTIGNSPQRVRLDFADERQNGATFASSLTGTVWGTFLVNTNGGGTAGIGVNSVVTFATFNGRPKLVASGTDLYFAPNDGVNADVTAPAVVPNTGDSLILFKMVFSGGGFTIDAWANPDLTAPLPEAQLLAASDHPNALSLDRLGVGGKLAAGVNSYVDFVTLSNGSNAFQDVTGQPSIPEPVINSISSGNASSGTTWSNGLPPQGGSIYQVLSTHTVTVDNPTFGGNALVVNGAVRSFTPPTLSMFHNW